MKSRLALPIVLAAFFALSVGLLWVRGAMDSSFAQHPDEPAHVVTGLMAHDYLTNPEPTHPLRYAEIYYMHYPKVAIGQWPPVFYGIQAVWMKIFGVSHLALLMLMATLSATVATLIFGVVRPRGGAALAFLTGALFLCVPLVQRVSGMVMAELPLAIFCFSAVLSFARYLETERWQWSAAFGVFAVLAILTKGNALALALVPALAMLLAGGKWHLLKRVATWVPAVLVVVICAPWYLFTVKMLEGSWSYSPGLAFIKKAGANYADDLIFDGAVVLTLIGIVGIFAPAARRTERTLWAGLVSFVIATVFMAFAIPASAEPRHLVMCLPALAVLFAFGARALTGSRPRATGLAAVALVALFALEGFGVEIKDERGFDTVARAVIAEAGPEGLACLIASDSRGEGAIVSEVAFADERPRVIVIRGSKVLGKESWSGNKYEDVFTSADDMQAYLEVVPVRYVLLDASLQANRVRPYHDALRELVESRPELWEFKASYTVVRRGVVYENAIRVFRLRVHEGRAVSKKAVGQR